jgi:hypothetical protein
VANLVASLLEVVVGTVESSLPPCLHLAVGSCKGAVRAAATSVASPPMIVIWDVESSLPRCVCQAVESCLGEGWATVVPMLGTVRSIRGSSDVCSIESNTNGVF